MIAPNDTMWRDAWRIESQENERLRQRIKELEEELAAKSTIPEPTEKTNIPNEQ